MFVKLSLLCLLILKTLKSPIFCGKTLNQIRSILNLDKPKVLEKCTWVAVSYEDNWYPGEITIKIDSTYTVKFLSRKDARGNYEFVQRTS
jgi:hypothetical protein